MSRPGASGARPAELDRSRPPEPGAPAPSRFPHFDRHRLDNGLTVLAARVEGVPMVYLDLLAPAGAHHAPEEAYGLASLTGALLDEGTAVSSAPEIAARIDRLGTSLATGADWNLGYVSSSLLARHLEEGLALMAEVATSPRFPEEEVERLRRERQGDLVRRRDQPSSTADDHLHWVLYGNQIYGAPLIGTEASLAKIHRDDLLAFYRDHYRRSVSTVLAVGDFDPEVLLAAVERHLGAPDEVSAPVSQTVEALPRAGLTVHVIDRPGAAQTELRLGQAGFSRLDPDFVPFLVMNSLLGGKFTSRINLNLRERHGYTYTAATRVYARLGPAPYSVAAAVETAVTGAAVREVLFELRRLRDETPPADEVRDAASYINGVFPYTLQTHEGVAKRLENLVVFGLPDDYYEGHSERILSVDAAAVGRVARRLLDPENMAVVAVGPAAELKPQLEDLGPVEVLEA